MLLAGVRYRRISPAHTDPKKNNEFDLFYQLSYTETVRLLQPLLLLLLKITSGKRIISYTLFWLMLQINTRNMHIALSFVYIYTYIPTVTVTNQNIITG